MCEFYGRAWERENIYIYIERERGRDDKHKIQKERWRTEKRQTRDNEWDKKAVSIKHQNSTDKVSIWLTSEICGYPDLTALIVLMLFF